MAMRGARGTPTGLPQAMSPEERAGLGHLRPVRVRRHLQDGPVHLPADVRRASVEPGAAAGVLPAAQGEATILASCLALGQAGQASRPQMLQPGESLCGHAGSNHRRWSVWPPYGHRGAAFGRQGGRAGEAGPLSRNNVLHLWPFVIHDLRSLGAKKFFGKFCAGSIDHISIRQLQLILLKVALLLGVEVHENVTFKDLLEPPEDQSMEKIGWRAQVLPADHPASQYEFDVLIGADGKRNTLKGFNRREFRGKLAIAITANFMNRHTLEEARVQEISGVAFIFNQRFFQDMKESTGIDLENIVYYKDDTHYFVMTAKKQSLLERGVIIDDYSDTARLLSPDNVDRSALKEYARDAADFATGYALPCLEFAVNHYGQPDVAMFDFTSMYAADNASRLLERHGHWLLQGLVGDSLLEPFWPTGSGLCSGLPELPGRCMDDSFVGGQQGFPTARKCRFSPSWESIYRLLAQTTPENLSKDMAEYSLNPSSRYPNLNLQTVLPSQRKRRRRDSIIHPDALLSWCQRQVALYSKIKIENMTSSWKDGLALCAILHRYRPDLIDLDELSTADVAANNQQAFDILEREYGIPPVMTGQEMADCVVPDKLTMVSYISQIYETFRREIPPGSPCLQGQQAHRGEPAAAGLATEPARQAHFLPETSEQAKVFERTRTGQGPQ
ncbi:hypothetical protein MRX96_038575 [Rhipicephalus microplus]